MTDKLSPEAQADIEALVREPITQKEEKK